MSKRKNRGNVAPAADDKPAAGAGAADAAAAAGAGQAGGADSAAAEAGADAQQATAANAGQVQGAADAAQDAPDAGAAEGEEAEGVTGGDDGQEEGLGDQGEQDPAASGSGDPDGEGDEAEADLWPIDADPAPPRNSMEVNVLAAAAAAAMAFGTTNDDATTLPRLDRAFMLKDGAMQAPAECAAGFVRANPDAPAEAIPIHLRMNGFRDVPQEGLRVMAAWRIFAFALRQLDQVDAELQRLAGGEAAKPARPSAHRDELAMMPAEPAFAPTGFSPRR